MREELAGALIARLAARGQTAACAESLTGGLLSDAFVRVPGASRVFLGGVVAYQEGAKEALLGVPGDVLRREGAVSAACARAMARGARKAFGADWALSATGYAGPEGADVGLVYIGCAGPEGAEARMFHFAGGREQVRACAAKAALALLAERLEIRDNTKG